MDHANDQCIPQFHNRLCRTARQYAALLRVPHGIHLRAGRGVSRRKRLFSSILSVLSFSELGIGAAITYELYKPIADKDSEKIRSLMLFYKKAYFFIGSFILLAGLVLLPFLPYLMKETTGLVNVRVIYVLFLVNNAASYWLFRISRTCCTVCRKTMSTRLLRPARP